MKHLSRDDLLLHWYAEVRTVPTERHLAACDRCRHALRSLAASLEGRPPARRPPFWRRIRFRVGWRAKIAGSASKG